MNGQNSEKRTVRENISLILRGYKLLFRMSPKNMFWRTVNCVMQQLTPYLTLYMSSMIINEIVAGADISYLISLAIITVFSQFAISTAINFINWKAYEYESVMWQHEELYFMDHQNRMKYEFLEDPDVTILRNKIADAKNQNAMGMMQLYWCYWFFLMSFINIILSVSLTASMLTMTAEGDFEGLLAFANSPLSALTVLVLIAVNVIISVVASNRSTVKIMNMWNEYSARNIRLNEYCNCYGNDAAVFDMRRLILKNLEKSIDPAFRKKDGNVRMKYGAVKTVWSAVMYFALLVFVGAKAYIGVFGIGSLILYRGTVEKFINACSTLGTRTGILFKNNEFLQQIFDYVSLPHGSGSGDVAIDKSKPAELEFCNVSFKYPRSEEYALKNVSLKFTIGEKLAIVGMNGSGKTTFIKLLCRLYDPTEGQILLNGRDVREYKYEDYIAAFSVVFQDYTMFAFTIAENVAGSLIYDKDRVISCLEKAGFGERLAGLEKGIETTLYRYYENSGVDISGGEAQKIAIARALYKEAPFIILDEPTAALDPVAEADIYSKFNDIVGKKTAIYISHRLSSCKFCDDIAVFDGGRVVQRGCHNELVMQKDGKYSELWHAQAQYYK